MSVNIGKKWNNGDMSGYPAKRRVAVKHQKLIDAPIDNVFRLACSEPGEGGWLLSCGSLLQRPELETLCHTVLHDPARHRFDVLLIHAWIVIARFQIEMDATDDDRTLVRFALTVTALNEQGDELFDPALGDRMSDALVQAGRSVCQLAERPDATIGPTAIPPIKVASEGGAKGVSREIIALGNPDECFALACAVAELKWVDGWCFDMISSESGQNEDNNIFLEPLSGLGVQRSPGANTYWYTTLFDTVARCYHAVLLTPESMIARFTFEVDDLGDGRTRMCWTLEYKALDGKGAMILAEPDFETRALGMLNMLALSAKQYIETGEMYHTPMMRRVKVLFSVICGMLGRYLRRRRQY